MIKEIIKFGSPTCGPCKVVEANLEKIKEQFPGIEVSSVDTNTCDEELLTKYNVMSNPTIVFVNEDGTYTTKRGLLSVEQIKELINGQG